MSTGADNSNFAPARRHRRIVVWVIFLGTIFGFGWYKAWENRRHQLASAGWHDAYTEFLSRRHVESNRILGHLHRLHGKPDSQTELTQQINDGKPFSLLPRGGREIADWTEPLYDLGARLEFEDGVLTGWKMSGDQYDYMRRNPPPNPKAWSGPAEQWRRWIARLGLGAWLISLAAWFALLRRRLVVSQFLLASALASGMAWLVSPGYSISWQGVFSNDNLALAAVMIVVSVYLLAVTLPAPSNSGIPFPRFRFRLWHILLMMAVAAVLLAAGPFGFVVVCVAVVGAILFAIVYYSHRSRLESTTASRP
jgi:hypothetical protein